MATITSGAMSALAGAIEVQEDVAVPIPGSLGGSQIVARKGDRITEERANDLGISKSGHATGHGSGDNTAAQRKGQTDAAPADGLIDQAAASEGAAKAAKKAGRRTTAGKPKEPRNATVGGRQTRGKK